MNHSYMDSCNCENSGMSPASPSHKDKSLAMAYVKWQKWQNVMDGCSGLKHGTIFEDLFMLFSGTKAACSQHSRGYANYNNMNYNTNFNNNYRRGM